MIIRFTNFAILAIGCHSRIRRAGNVAAQYHDLTLPHAKARPVTIAPRGQPAACARLMSMSD
jgi:hypothetical protein